MQIVDRFLLQSIERTSCDREAEARVGGCQQEVKMSERKRVGGSGRLRDL